MLINLLQEGKGFITVFNLLEALKAFVIEPKNGYIKKDL